MDRNGEKPGVQRKKCISMVQRKRGSNFNILLSPKKIKEASEEKSESASVKNEVVRIDFKGEERALSIPSVSTEKIRMIKGDVLFEFPVSVTGEVLSAVMRGGGIC